MSKNMQQAVDHMMGFFQADALNTALSLKLFDALGQTPTPTPVLAETLSLPAEPLDRLLTALTAMGYLEKNSQGYLLPETHRAFLVSDQPLWLGWLANHIQCFLRPLWGHLESAIRDGRHQRKTVFGDNRSWFDILYQNPDDVADFQEFLGKFAHPFIEGFVQAYDFSRYRRFLDIGSGIGTLPIAIAEQYSHLDIAICDLPQASAFLRDKLKEQGFGERIDVVEGDVIAGDLPQEVYDLIHLGWMLHDYGPETQLTILRNIYQSMPVGGRFIASETPLDADKSGPEFTALLSLNMLVSTDGGLESSVDEYMQRFTKVGFAEVEVIEIPGPRTLITGTKR
jgi:SAM-dependent methyltransferase